MNTRTRTFKTVCLATLISVAAAPGVSHAGWWADNNPVKKVVNKVKSAPANTVAKVKEAPVNIQDQVEELLNKVNEVHSQVEESQPLVNAMKEGKIISDLQEIMTFLNESRQGYEAFANGGVQAFSQDITGLLYDVRDIGDMMNLGGNTERLAKAEDLINRMPPQLMYLMHEAFGTMIIDMREQTLQLSNRIEFLRGLPSNRDLLSAPESHASSLCPIINDKATKISYTVVKSRLASFKNRVGLANDMMPDDLTISLTVVGGGGATVSKFPAKYVTLVLKALVEEMELRLNTIHEIATVVCE